MGGRQAGGPARRKPNPRFLATSLPASTHPAQESNEDFRCAGGDAEDRVKERKRRLRLARGSSNLFNANALRLYSTAFAFVPVRPRRAAFKNTALGRADFATLRLRSLKIGAIRCRSTRRIPIAMSSACPDRETFRLA